MPTIYDFANNPLQFGDNVAKLIVKLSEETDLSPLSIYAMLNASLRDSDARVGRYLLKRLVGGFEQQWARIEGTAQALRTLRSVADAPAPILRYLQLHLGWTDDLLPITVKLDDATLRALLAASPNIWRFRGLEDGYAAILLAGMDLEYVFDINWFDFRWILDVNAFGEDRRGRDVHLIDLPGPPHYDDMRSNLRIVDPDGKADRSLAYDFVNLFRGMNERITITWLEFADRFTSDRGWSAGTVTAGRLTVASTAAQAPLSRADGAGGHIAYYRARIVPVEDLESLGVMFRIVDASNRYEAVLYLPDNTLYLYRTLAGVTTSLAAFDFTTILETLAGSQWYGLRVEMLPFAATQLIRVYVDGVMRIEVEDASHLTGGHGVIAGAQTTIEVSDVEVMSLPGDTQEVP